MLRPTIPPTVEPVTLTEARVQCQMSPDDTSQDARLLGYVAAARGMAEQETGQRFLPQTWELYLDAWPADGKIELPQLPVRSITSVKYTSTAGVLTTVSAGAYRLDTRALRAVLQPVYGGAWPTDVRGDDEGVIVVTYICGLAASANELANVAPGIREWVLAHVAAMNEQRSAVSEVGNNMAMLPYAGSLLDPWRVYL
jgi:uncharacterized phiE125 gp8 family phage protein